MNQSDKNTLSRRSFLTGAAATAGLAAFAGLAGCAPQSTTGDAANAATASGASASGSASAGAMQTTDPAQAVWPVVEEVEVGAAGKDEDFNFPGEMMLTIDTPPYDATKEFADGLCTAGGLLVDTECRVLDKDRQPIDGLFAIGLTSGGMFFNTYPHNLNCLSHTRRGRLGFTVGRGLGDLA